MKTTIAAIALTAALAAAAQEPQAAQGQPAPAGQPAESVLADVAENAETSEAAEAAEAEEAAEAPEAAPDATAPAAPAETPEAAAAEAQAPEQQATDEIDLEELDDAALAAARPKVTAGDGDDKRVDVDCDEATLADILRQFRKTTGENIIVGESTNLMRRVSVTLRRTPWRQALTAILNSRGFRLDDRDGIYRVVEDRQVVPVVTQTFPLNHASAKELAELFNASYGTKDKNGKTVRRIATCFEGANVVVVTAEEKTISDCARIVKEVDVAVPQIYIEARFAELSSEALHKLGLDWSSLKSWGASAKDMEGGASWSRNPKGKVGLNNDSATANRHDVSGDGAYVTGSMSIDDFRLAISAFESDSDARIFSNPKVIVSNGKEAHVDMTTKFPNVELTSQRGTVSSSTYTDFSAKIQQIPGDKDKGLFAGSAFYSWGIELTVRPRISPDGLISVEITPAISDLDKDVTEDGFYKIKGGGTDSGDSAYSSYPIIKYKAITTDFTMKNGSTAVIGGLSRTVEEDVDTGIPYLRKIPWAGQKLFGWKSRQKVQKEIIIFVTLGIANPDELPKDLGLPKNAVMGREYVTGERLEPGDRPGTSAEVLDVDRRDLADSREAGRVSVTVSK